MKAITRDSYGSADVLELTNVAVPRVGDDEVLVRIRAASVSAAVWHMMTGLPYMARAAFGFRRPRNPVCGLDLAGHVEAVGREVTLFDEGDEVYGTCAGSYAEFGCAKEDKLTAKPANLSFEQAAAVPDSGCTALHGIRDVGEVQNGQRVLITGASGGVGTFAVQLAKDIGAEVTGVASTPNLEAVRSIGADHVVDYTREDITTTGERYDVIVDIAGNTPLSKARSALTPRGTLVIVGGEGGGKLIGGTDRQLRALLLSPFVRHKLRAYVSTTPREELLVLTQLIEAGRITPVIDRTYPLNEAPDALRRFEHGHGPGKIVLSV